MHIPVKTPEELAIMEKSGKILANTVWEVLSHAKAGVSELELDSLAEKLIRKQGGEPAFKYVEGYNHTICVSTNDVVVHGIPTSYRLQEGDVIGIDCGVLLDGWNSDMSETIIVSNPSPRLGGKSYKTNPQNEAVKKFLETGKRALEEAIKQVKIGNRIGHISQTIQRIVEKEGGYGVTRELIGHGVGKELHEEPPVPGYLYKKIEKTPLLQEGMVIAVEVIYNMGKKEIVFAGTDDWTIKTKDGSLSGLFERTVAVTKNGHKVLTP